MKLGTFGDLAGIAKIVTDQVQATGGVVPVDRALRHDPRLFTHVFRCLELGGAVALFPEGDIGAREGEIQPSPR